MQKYWQDNKRGTKPIDILQINDERQSKISYCFELIFFFRKNKWLKATSNDFKAMCQLIISDYSRLERPSSTSRKHACIFCTSFVHNHRPSRLALSTLDSTLCDRCQTVFPEVSPDRVLCARIRGILNKSQSRNSDSEQALVRCHYYRGG